MPLSSSSLYLAEGIFVERIREEVFDLPDLDAGNLADLWVVDISIRQTRTLRHGGEGLGITIATSFFFFFLYKPFGMILVLLLL